VLLGAALLLLLTAASVRPLPSLNHCRRRRRR